MGDQSAIAPELLPTTLNRHGEFTHLVSIQRFLPQHPPMLVNLSDLTVFVFISARLKSFDERVKLLIMINL